MNTVLQKTIGIAAALLTLSLLYCSAGGAQAAESPTSGVIGVAGAPQLSQSAHNRDAGPLDGTLCCIGVEPLAFHGNEAIAITGRAGIFKSFDRGTSWARSMAGLIGPNGVSPLVNAICQAPSDPRTIYAIAGDGEAVTPFNGVFSSSDFGSTWTRRGSADTGFGFNQCTVDSLDPRKLYIFGFDSTTFLIAMWRSNDGGQTQQIFGAGLPDCQQGGPFPRPGILYLVGKCPGFSTDDGKSFQPLTSFPPDSFAVDISPDGNSILIATSAGTFRSIDRGMSFTPVSGLPNGFNSSNLAFDRTNAARIYATDGALYISEDGGASFTPVAAADNARFPGPIDDISVDPRGSLFINTPDGIFRSDDAGKKFQNMKEGFRASSLNDLAFDAQGRLLVPVYHTQALFRQTYGANFDAIGNTLRGVDGTAVAASPADSNIIVLGTDFEGMFRTDDGGRTWSSVTVSDGTTTFPSARMSFATTSRVYLATSTGLYRSDDAGQSFAQLADLSLGAVAVDPCNPDILYVGTYNSGEGLFKSTDGGRTLRDLGQPAAYTTLVVDRRDSKIVYAGQRSGRVLRSVDGGKTFALMSSGLRGAGVLGLAQDAQGTLFAWIRGGGLFASDDRAVKWRVVDSDQALQRSGAEAGRTVLVADPRRPGHVYLGNGGVLEITDAGAGD
jgi:photosystem II stability/assembly factor-like uncharacterized protein